ncbi:rhodanese-like protein [delta proteobacterium NaphS2]|nr:rhodanese-like protein [delta proteobacterium NaphS2]
MNHKKYHALSPSELNGWIKEKKSFYLIDTLLEDHFRKIHLPGAVNACVFQVIFMEQIKGITDDKEVPIVVYGSSDRSMDAATAAGKLVENGYRDVHLLGGGIEAWRNAGFPLAGEATLVPDNPETLLVLENRSYEVDPDQSTIQWWGRNPNTTHFGNVGIAKGEMTVNDGIITGAVHMDMDVITNINLEGNRLQPVLIAHLKSDDFFLTRLFPEARFDITHAEPVEKPFLSVPNYRVEGALRIRGISAKQGFMATIANTPENGLAAEAHFDIDRTRWGVIYGSARFFEHLGMHLVFDLISFQVRIIAF